MNTEQVILPTQKGRSLFHSNKEFDGWMYFNMRGNFDREVQINEDTSIEGLEQD